MKPEIRQKHIIMYFDDSENQIITGDDCFGPTKVELKSRGSQIEMDFKRIVTESGTFPYPPSLWRGRLF